MTVFDKAVFKRTYSVLVENEPGVLSRVSGLFSARGYNILSLSVGETNDHTMSRMTIVVEGTPTVLEQVNKQLNKLIPVISVLPLIDDEMVSRELIMVKVKDDDGLEACIQKFQAEDKMISVVHHAAGTTLLQFVVSPADREEIFKGLEQFTLKEVCRSGAIAMSKTRNFSYFEKSDSRDGQITSKVS
ncbi:MAG: acetolactate synthase-1/3 small subunit [Candidatus Omnitrophota bacterium]|jgi:acetolactate synthase-1/3 small subunit